MDEHDAATRVEAASAGFVLNEPTLALANIRKRAIENGRSSYVDSRCVIQVTARTITLVEYDPILQTFNRVGDVWTPEKENAAWKGREIVAASLNPSQFVVALSGGAILLFNTDDKGNLSFVRYVHPSFISVALNLTVRA